MSGAGLHRVPSWRPYCIVGYPLRASVALDSNSKDGCQMMAKFVLQVTGLDLPAEFNN